MDLKMKMLKEIAFYTSSTDFYQEAKEWGDKAAAIFEKKAQLQNLLNISNTTMKITDLLNYIKNQAGKEKKPKNGEEPKGWLKDKFAGYLIDLLYDVENKTGLLAYTQKIIASDNLKGLLNQYHEHEIHLKICREFIKQMVIHYNFAMVESNDI